MAIALDYGVPTDKCALQLQLGAERGFFREEGLELSRKVVFGGPEIARMYDSGTLKIGEIGTPPCLTAIRSGGRFRIVGSGARRGPVQFLVTRGGLSTWSDLRGRTLGALSRGSCSYWFLRKALEVHGLNPDTDVEIVGLGDRYPEIVSLLAHGEIDGAITAEPNVTEAERERGCRVWFGLQSVDFMPRMQWTVCVANLDVIAREPGLIQAVLRACRRSYHYAAENPDEWASIGARSYGIDRDTMLRSIGREREFLHLDCEIDLEGLASAIEFQRSLGSIDGETSLEDVADMRFQRLLAAPESGSARGK